MSRIRLTWTNASTTIVEQRVYRSISPLDIDNMPDPLAVLPRRNREYLDSTVEDGLAYYYAVSSVLPDYSELISEQIKVEATPGGSDPYWDNVVALLHFDGNAADEKGNQFIEQGATLTYSMSPDPAFNEEAVFGEGWLEIGASDDFNLGFEDFTIEGFITMNAFDKSYGAVISSGEPSFNQANQTITVPGNGQPGARTVRLVNRLNLIANPLVATTTLMETGIRYHFVVARESGVFYAFLNGVLEGTRSVNAEVNFSNQGTLIGRNKWDGGNGMFNGKIDELRITKGVARYTENFTPPTEPFPNN